MKRLLIIVVLLMSLNILGAVPPFSNTAISFGGFQISSDLPIAIPQNATRYWEIHIFNDSALITSAVTCDLHIYDEDGTGEHLYKNESSVFIGDDIEIITPPDVHAIRGLYSYKIYCNTSDNAGLYEKNYYVTKSGQPPADDLFTAVIWIVFIISAVLLFYCFFINIAKIAMADITIYNILLSWASYILLIIVNYLGAEYLLRPFIEDISGMLLNITMWTNGVLPAIGFFLTIFIKSMTKKRVLTPQEITGRFLTNG